MNKKQSIIAIIGILLAGIPIIFPIQKEVYRQILNERNQFVNKLVSVPDWTVSIAICVIIALITLVAILYYKDKKIKDGGTKADNN